MEYSGTKREVLNNDTPRVLEKTRVSLLGGVSVIGTLPVLFIDETTPQLPRRSIEAPDMILFTFMVMGVV